MNAHVRGHVPEWLQSVPGDWDVALLRLVVRVESGHTPSRSHPEYWVPKECTIPWFSLADIWQLREGRQKYLGDTKEKISPRGMANSAARLLPAGTVVLSRTASVGFSGIMPRPMATTQDFANFVCGKKLLPEFLLWVLRGMRTEFERLRMGSTHQTIYMPDVLQFRVPIIPVKVQRTVADFLDRRTAATDVLIEKKERLIELLQEKRHALITQAVSRGLDPSVPMKDSGVDWLGEIPAHWQVAPLQRLKKFGTSITYGIVQCGPDVADGVPYIRTSDLSGSELPVTGYPKAAHEIEGKYVRSRVKQGDVVVSVSDLLCTKVSYI
jgi:type I restriction enzyme, S subunit